MPRCCFFLGQVREFDEALSNSQVKYYGGDQDGGQGEHGDDVAVETTTRLGESKACVARRWGPTEA